MRCSAACGSEARLFFLPASNLDMEEAIDLSGKPYITLRTANLYKKTAVPGCQCRPDPWSAAELSRHRQYADLEEPERAKAHAAAIAVVVTDAGGSLEPVAGQGVATTNAPPGPAVITESATATEPEAPAPVPAVRPPRLAAKPTVAQRPHAARGANAGPINVHLTATPAQQKLLQRMQAQQPPSFGLFGQPSGPLVWPGDSPKAR
jgi:hypothetical protein